MAKKVFLIHGILSFGTWHHKTAQVLEPHFKCERVRYLNYIFGPVGIIIGRWNALLAAAFLLLAVFLHVHFWMRVAFIFTSIALFAIALFAEAPLRRRYTVHLVRRKIEQKLHPNERCHVIAHSMGCYLMGSYAAGFRARLKKVIMVGSVLPQEFDWQGCCAGEKPSVAGDIRNEIAKNDWVVGLADRAMRRLPRWRYWSTPDIGASGLKGFRGHPSQVHDIANPFQGCQECDPGAFAKVHNVYHDEVGHSDIVSNSLHARDFWLPYLWGLVPWEFVDFLELCIACEVLEREGNIKKLMVVEGHLHKAVWTWPRYGRQQISFKSFIQERVTNRLKSKRKPYPRELVHRYTALVIRGVWQMVGAAFREYDKPIAERDPEAARMLYPHAAVTRVLRKLVP